MTEDNLLKLLEMVAHKVKRTQAKHPAVDLGDDDQWDRSFDNAFEEVKKLLESLQDNPGSCRGPYTEELPEDSEISWRWRVYGCGNHAHIIHLRYGDIVIGNGLAEKILVLGLP